MTPTPNHGPGPGPGAGDQLRALTQEQMVLAQAKNNVVTLEPRLETIRLCLETLENSLTQERGDFGTEAGLTDLILAMVKIQLIQLNAALKEGQANLEASKRVIAEIESPIKLFGRR